MTDENKDLENKKDIVKLFYGNAAFITPLPTQSDNPWTPEEVDTLESDRFNSYKDLVKACRFFYKKDPLSATTLNKMVEIGINNLTLGQNKLSANEFRMFKALLPKLQEFAEQMALEFLISGLVVPEISFTSVSTDILKIYNVKKYSSLVLPTSMWLRDPATIIINTSMFGSEPSYFVQVPDDMLYFIQNSGTYRDGTKDELLFNKLKIEYPEFIASVLAGKTKIQIENKLIFRRKTQSYQDYPIPYLEPALEALKHKRNLRRMDYSLASRVISAILLFRLGSDEFPVTEDDSDTFEELRNQLLYRDNTGKNVERIFQLFANHTLQVDWIMPDIAAMIDDAKYKDINQELIFALGFPRILITGETERTGSSEAEFATLSPARTMETFRSKIIEILKYIVNETARRNGFSDAPEIKFEPINLMAFADFIDAIRVLYESGNMSRTAFANLFGLTWEDEMDIKEKENKILEEKGLEINAPMPFSPQPGGVNNQNNTEEKDIDEEEDKTKK